jgi:hypothetical protein
MGKVHDLLTTMRSDLALTLTPGGTTIIAAT